MTLLGIIVTLGFLGLAFLFYFKIASVISAILISASPFCMAAFIGMASQRFNRWLVFFIWLIVLYSFMSYDKLRKSIIFLSSCMCGVFTVFMALVLFGGLLPEGEMTRGVLTIIVLVASGLLSLYLDKQSGDYLCINIAKHFSIPMFIQRILASAIYGFTGVFILSYAFTLPGAEISEKNIRYKIVQWILFFIIGAIAYFVDVVLSKLRPQSANSACAQSADNSLPESSDLK